MTMWRSGDGLVGRNFLTDAQPNLHRQILPTLGIEKANGIGKVQKKLDLIGKDVRKCGNKKGRQKTAGPMRVLIFWKAFKNRALDIVECALCAIRQDRVCRSPFAK